MLSIRADDEVCFLQSMHDTRRYGFLTRVQMQETTNAAGTVLFGRSSFKAAYATHLPQQVSGSFAIHDQSVYHAGLALLDRRGVTFWQPLRPRLQ